MRGQVGAENTHRSSSRASVVKRNRLVLASRLLCAALGGAGLGIRRAALLPKLVVAAVTAVCVVGVIALVFAIGNSHVAGRVAAGHGQSGRSGANTYTVASPSPTVDQQALQACIAEETVNCAETVPGLAQCMAEKRIDCNQSAAQQMLPAQINAASGAPMSESAAISAARQGGPASAASAPAAAQYMSLSQYYIMEPAERGAFPGLSPSRMVWVVTIHASVYDDPLPGSNPAIYSSYTVVIDAVSGQGLVYCVGCAAVG